MERNTDGKPLIILYVLVCLTGIGYYYLTLRAGNLALWSYDKDLASQGGAIPKVINYVKDVYLLLLMVRCFVEQNPLPKLRRKWAYALAIVLVGLVLDILSDQSIMCVVAGIRGYGYAFLVYIYLTGISTTKTFYENLYKVVFFITILQTLAVILQVSRVGGGFSLGAGAYRMMGLFTNAGSLGFFAVGASIVFSCFYMKFDFVKVFHYVVLSILVMFLALASGGRGPIMYSIVFLALGLLSRTHLGEKAKFVLIPILVVAVGYTAMDSAVDYIGRGDLMVSGKGRFMAWTDLFDMNLRTILLGDGLGVGTNTAKSMGVTSVNMDSTFTVVIVQFGLWGFFIFMHKLFEFGRNLIKFGNCDLWYRIWFVLFICMILFSGSLFEQYAMIIPIVITAHCMLNYDMNKSETNLL